MKKTFLLLITLTSVLLSSAQSINGTLNAASSNEALGYANVDIYKGNKLVASVLSDREGNYNVALDTGTYECVVNYAGYKTERKVIHVKEDERADFKVASDPAKQKAMSPVVVEDKSSREAYVKKEEERERPKTYSWSGKPIGESRYGVSAPGGVTDEVSYGFVGSGVPGSPESYGLGTGKPKLGGRSGALTAGEINDFAKWTLWQDISETTLGSYQKLWNIAPKGRYTVELHTQGGIPLADALVRLKKRDGQVLFQSRTDNTGKAELWLTIKFENPEIPGGLFIEVLYNGKTTRINDVQPFEQTVNHQVLNVSCEQSENVDVAFVVDATGSMGDELSYLQAELNDIVFQSKKISKTLNFRFANVFYRDAGPNELYLTKSMDFNRILSESINYINEQSAGGGGDYEEAVEIALDSAINRLGWSDNARARILFLILDAPPHKTDPIRTKMEQLIRQAAEKGIRIVPIGASGIDKSTEYLMRCLALGTNGTYTFLTDHSGIGEKHIEPTTDKYDVETLNKMMVRILKSYTYMPDCEQQLPDLDLPYADSIVAYPSPVDSLDTNNLVNNTNNQARDTVHVQWNYWPNPTNGIVNITADVDISELYVTDLSGKVLQVLKNLEKDRTVQIDLSAYATGIYLIRYPVGKTWISGKVVLQRNS